MTASDKIAGNTMNEAPKRRPGTLSHYERTPKLPCGLRLTGRTSAAIGRASNLAASNLVADIMSSDAVLAPGGLQ
jgi:hypothetical protein